MLLKSWKRSIATIAILSLTLVVQVPSFASPEGEVGVVCKATKAMNQKALGKFHAYVINADTGAVLIDINGTELTPSASVIKALTAVAALKHLPDEYRATTSVLTVPSEPGTLVLQGGGDYTLSRLGPGESSVYSKPPRIRALAREVIGKLDPSLQVTKIILDDSFFTGSSWNPDWPLSYRTLGYVSHITALQADGDRVQPNRLVSNYSFRRGPNPVKTVGKIFREYLGDRALDAELVVAPTPSESVLLAQVQSQDVRTNWLGQMLTHSDNTGAEFIARHAARAAGLEPNQRGVSTIIKRSLRELGLKPKTFVIRDASGLSDQNRVHARLLAKLMVKVANGENGLDALTQWMPVAGESGTLKYRFQGSSAVARGQVVAKTGYIPGLYGLSGIVYAQDGSRLAFAVFARKDDERGLSVTYTAQRAIDRVVTRFYLCGASLTQ